MVQSFQRVQSLLMVQRVQSNLEVPLIQGVLGVHVVLGCQLLVPEGIGIQQG